MERPPVFTLDVLADRTLLNDVLKGSPAPTDTHPPYRSPKRRLKIERRGELWWWWTCPVADCPL